MPSDPLFPVLLVLRYLHIFGAIALFGGSLFAWFAVVPSLATLKNEEKKGLHEEIRNRWKWVAHAAILAILVSGIVNLVLASRYNFPDEGGKMIYNMLAGLKLLISLPVFFIAAMLTGRSALSQKFREKVGFWLTVNLVLATIMVLMGGMLRFVVKTPKAGDEKPAAAIVAPLEIPA